MSFLDQANAPLNDDEWQARQIPWCDSTINPEGRR